MPNEPSRELVLRVVQEEALTTRVTITDILDMHVSPAAVAARVRCWKRIMQEADCGSKGLARVWGCSPRAIRDQLHPKTAKAPTAQKPSVYDPATLARLAFQYGPDRAEAIAAGQDRATSLDIARWNRLCRRAA